MWEYNYTPSSDELYHHGIKGMKWGKRRYQNKDGSLTPAGKKRYNSDAERNLAEKKAAYKAANKAYSKSINKAYDRAIAAYSPSKKHRQANDERWDDAFKKAEELKVAKSEYKQAKADYKKTVEKHVSGKKVAAVAGLAVVGVGAAAVGKFVYDGNRLLNNIADFSKLG